MGGRLGACKGFLWVLFSERCVDGQSPNEKLPPFFFEPVSDYVHMLGLHTRLRVG